MIFLKYKYIKITKIDINLKKFKKIKKPQNKFKNKL